MGTDKRERQKAGRMARAEAAKAAQRKAANRRRAMVVGVIVLLIGGLFAFMQFIDDDDGSTVDDQQSSPLTTLAPGATTTIPEAVAPGTDCVELADELPPGAPAFTVPTGPPGEELVVDDIVVGTGPEVQPEDTVTLHYVGANCSTGTIFDSSYTRGEPAIFELDGLIRGWQLGIPGMKVGGQRLLVIPPDLGYGAQGRPGSIPGNETLVFFVSVEATEPAPSDETPAG
jgi:peptidylprolyl isomerase